MKKNRDHQTRRSPVSCFPCLPSKCLPKQPIQFVLPLLPPLCVADYDSTGYRQAQFLFSLTNSSRCRSCDIFSLTSFPAMLSIRESALFATQPNAQRAPRSNDWHSNETDRVQAQPDGVHRAIRPRANLIAEAVTECVDHAFRLVLVFASQNREQDLARRTKQREPRGASHHLKNCEHNQDGGITDSQKTQPAQRRHQHESESDAERLQQTT